MDTPICPAWKSHRDYKDVATRCCGLACGFRGTARQGPPLTNLGRYSGKTASTKAILRKLDARRCARLHSICPNQLKNKIRSLRVCAPQKFGQILLRVVVP